MLTISLAAPTFHWSGWFLLPLPLRLAVAVVIVAISLKWTWLVELPIETVVLMIPDILILWTLVPSIHLFAALATVRSKASFALISISSNLTNKLWTTRISPSFLLFSSVSQHLKKKQAINRRIKKTVHISYFVSGEKEKITKKITYEKDNCTMLIVPFVDD